MVAVGGVVVGFLLAPCVVVVAEEGAFADGEGGDADAGEGEVVGAIEVAGHGEGIALEGEAVLFGEGFDERVDGGSFRAVDGAAADVADGGEVVEVEVERDVFCGRGRVLAQGIGSQADPALLR